MWLIALAQILPCPLDDVALALAGTDLSVLRLGVTTWTRAVLVRLSGI